MYPQFFIRNYYPPSSSAFFIHNYYPPISFAFIISLIIKLHIVISPRRFLSIFVLTSMLFMPLLNKNRSFVNAASMVMS